mmetsp:Transcript_24998/g.30748  ORF Transcript_24998/g.30748 Transcript_24998/m.30748 type:complete len:93 (+) Transcript_24998:408-686(+)
MLTSGWGMFSGFPSLPSTVRLDPVTVSRRRIFLSIADRAEVFIHSSFSFFKCFEEKKKQMKRKKSKIQNRRNALFRKFKKKITVRNTGDFSK